MTAADAPESGWERVSLGQARSGAQAGGLEGLGTGSARLAQSEYLVIVEKFGSGAFGDHEPELPGIAVAGETEDDGRRLVGEAIRLYLDEPNRGDDRGSE